MSFFAPQHANNQIICTEFTDSDFRDGGLPFSRFFARVHDKHEMPLNALILTTALVVVFGCIFLGSSR